MSKTYWHFAAIQDGKPVMRDGTMIEPGKRYEVPKAVICESGFHGSARAIDALQYAPGPWVSKRDIDEVIRGDDKVCGPACVHTEGFDATEILRKFARLCALDVIDLWDSPEIVVRYLKTGDESIRIAARYAAMTAAIAAARAAEMYTEMYAATDVTRYAARAAATAAEMYAEMYVARASATNAARAAARYAATASATDAATTAARAAVTAAEMYAVWDAVRGKQNRRLTIMLNAELKIVEATDE